MELLGNHPNGNQLLDCSTCPVLNLNRVFAVVRFCGVCVVPPNLCIVTQYFAQGSVEVSCAFTWLASF
jgi:hypothetical protein